LILIQSASPLNNLRPSFPDTKMALILMNVSLMDSLVEWAWACDIRRRFRISWRRSLAFFCKPLSWLYISGVSWRSAEMFKKKFVCFVLFFVCFFFHGLDSTAKSYFTLKRYFTAQLGTSLTPSTKSSHWGLGVGANSPQKWVNLIRI
jgi:hypothetical protein